MESWCLLVSPGVSWCLPRPLITCFVSLLTVGSLQHQPPAIIGQFSLHVAQWENHFRLACLLLTALLSKLNLNALA